MRHFNFIIIAAVIIIIMIVFFMSFFKNSEDYCLVGGFIADAPGEEDIEEFQKNYTKKPYLVMVFVDWENFVDEKIVSDIYSKECLLLLTWEPWYAQDKQGLDYDKILSGQWDAYITEFAQRLKSINKIVFLRFAHEMNGNWYPWSASNISGEKYIAMYRYIKDIFDRNQATNIKWIFSINWEDVPGENNFRDCYPGDGYVDFIGIDGYNWGNTQAWSKWMSFKEIFEKRYQEITSNLKKSVIISEFSSTSKGGNKAIWIKEAMSEIKKMKKIKAFVLFNVDKEVDWGFPINKESGRELRLQLKDNYFKDKGGLYD